MITRNPPHPYYPACDKHIVEEKNKRFVYIDTHCTPESFLTDMYILNYNNSLQIHLMGVLLFLVYTRKTWKHRVFKYIIQDNYLLGGEE